jgi:hypothetical protein
MNTFYQTGTTQLIDSESIVPNNGLLLPANILTTLASDGDFVNLWNNYGQEYIIDGQLPLTDFYKLIGETDDTSNPASLNNRQLGNTFFLKTFWIKFIIR